MRSNADRSSMDDASTVNASLRSWYDANPVVRRAWVTEDSSAIRVYVSLEPTPDGNDILPVWLAHCSEWKSDLQSLTNRTVRLYATFSGPDSDDEGVIIAELGWRDPSSSSRWEEQ